MSKKTIFLGITGLLLLPGLGLADEIEPSFMAGYRMGFFMAVSAGNPHKICGNVHFASMLPVIKEYESSNTTNYPLKYKEILDLEAKFFPCPKTPAVPQPQ